MRTTKSEVLYVESDIDHEIYLVRDLVDKQEACNMLALIKKNILSLTDYMYANKEKKEYINFTKHVDQLNSRIRKAKISESDSNNIYTSYSVNKGEEIIFCLRSKKDNRLHDINIVMYVVLHEMAHVACPEYGHTDLFKKIFAFFTDIAINQNMYKKNDFSNNPTEYCGLIISEHI